jgi:hypothetical protein
MQRPRRETRGAIVALATAALLCACAAPAPSRTLYQWTDHDGNARYTAYPDRVPVESRDTRKAVVPGATAIANAASPPAVRREPGEGDLPRGPRVTPAQPPSAPATSPLDERIRELEALVSADQETLKTLIADPERSARLRESPELREISQRLPGLQRELDALRAQRDGSAIPDDS